MIRVLTIVSFVSLTALSNPEVTKSANEIAKRNSQILLFSPEQSKGIFDFLINTVLRHENIASLEELLQKEKITASTRISLERYFLLAASLKKTNEARILGQKLLNRRDYDGKKVCEGKALREKDCKEISVALAQPDLFFREVERLKRELLCEEKKRSPLKLKDRLLVTDPVHLAALVGSSNVEYCPGNRITAIVNPSLAIWITKISSALDALAKKRKDKNIPSNFYESIDCANDKGEGS